MQRRSDNPDDLDRMREKLIGLGERSIRKSYYPKLHESEQNLRTILDSIYDAVFILEIDGAILDVNRTVLEMFRIDREQALHSRTLKDFSALDNFLDKTAEIWIRAIAGEEQLFEWKARRPNDGSVFDVEVFLRKIRFRAHDVILATVRDITKRKKAEESLQLTQFAFDHAAVPAFIIDRDARILYANEQAALVEGYTRDELLSMSIPDLDPNFPFSRWGDHWEQLKEEGYLHFESLHRTKSGTLLPMDISVNYIAFGGREYNIGFALDISERKKAQQRLGESEERFRQLAENTEQVFWFLEPESQQVLYVNPAFERIWGVPAEDLYRDPGLWPRTIHPDDRARVEEAFSNWYRGTADSFDTDYRIVRPDGSLRWVRDRGTLVRDDQGRLIRLSGIADDITDRKQVEESLKLSQFSLDQSSISVFFVEPDGRFLYVNEQACRTLGYTRQELLSMSVPDIDPQRSRSSWKDRWQQIRKERTLHFETTHRKKDGKLIPMQMSVNYHSYAGHEYNVAFALNISDRKKAENELRRAYDLVRTVLDSMNDAVSLINARDFTIAGANTVFLRSYGYSSESEVLGKHCYELTHGRPDVCSPPDDICPLVETVRTKGHFSVDHVHYDRQGEKIYVEVSTSPIKDEAGNVVQVVHVQRNITERKRAEEALRESEERFRAFFESAGVGTAQVDPYTRKFLRINAEFSRMTGYSSDELKTLTFSDITHPEDRTVDAERFAETIRPGAPMYQEEKRYIRKDGRVIWVHISATLVRDSDDRPLHTAVVIQDITARKQAEQALRQSEQFLRMVLDNLIAFVGVLSPGGIVIEVNRSALEAGGLSARDVAGKPFEETYWISWSPEVRGRIREAIRKAAQGLSSRFDVQARMAGETRMPVDFMLAPIYGEQGRVTHLIASAVDITDRKRMEDEIRHLAHHDVLTGLPNRRLFNDVASMKLAQTERKAEKVGVLFLDLDRFKEINDTLGHEAGDELLTQVGQRLRSLLRRSDSIGRLGGDEFSIVLGDIGRPEAVSDIAKKIVDSFEAPFAVAGRLLQITTSIGVSIFPDDGKNIEELLKQADAAMYLAKESGRNTFRFYDPSINMRSVERMRLEQMLRRSLEFREMVLFYQPLFDAVTGKMMCAEALLRWRHPERGLLLPADFMTAAEETGFISEIDEWVLTDVCRQIAVWKNAGLRPPCVTVNISDRRFRDPELSNLIASTLEKTGTPGDLLHIEVSESTAMTSFEHTRAVMDGLAALQVHFSIDGFGTGYSSLSHIKRMPIEKLKLDRSLIREIAVDPDGRAVIKAATAMAHSMNIRVIAEGVETREQLSLIRESGCDEVQGFLLGMPVPADELEKMME